MKKIYLFVFVLAFPFAKTFSQCAETNTPRVLLVGDSWAWFMNTESTINNVFDQWGLSGYTFVSNATISENGADTKDFIKVDKQAEILNQLNLNPTIDYVHLSIGGNDFLGDWNLNMTQGQTDSLTDDVFVRLDSIVRFIKSCRPGIKILWSGYVYTNFKEVIESLGAIQNIHPFYGTWQGMGFPTPIQINTLQNHVSDLITNYASTHSDFYFVNCSGLMQYIYGQTTPLGIPPGGTIAPYTVPLPLGDPNYPSNRTTMRDYGFTKDCYHLSTQGYKDLISYHTQKFYHKELMDDLYILSENNSQTGTVSSAGNVADSLVLGENSGEQFALALSFNTTSMADTTLSKASIFLRRKSLAGSDPAAGNWLVKIKNGNFGTTANVEAADFSAADDANGTPCLFGAHSNNYDWIRLDLPANVLSHINNSGTTQFIITAPGFTGGTVVYNNSSDPDFAPVLNLVYGPAPNAINELSDEEFSIYPNPTNGILTIKKGADAVTHIEINNMMGEVVMQPAIHQNTIDVSPLASGIYVLNITTKSGKSSQRLIKQ